MSLENKKGRSKTKMLHSQLYLAKCCPCDWRSSSMRFGRPYWRPWGFRGPDNLSEILDRMHK
eukprot:1357683-Amorphochlora_amoeboformis.AAC.1